MLCLQQFDDPWILLPKKHKLVSYLIGISYMAQKTKIIRNVSTKAALFLTLVFGFLLISAPAFAANPDCSNTLNAKGTVSQSKVQSCLTQSPIVHDINIVVNGLSAGVGVVVTAVIIVGGVQYSMAGDNPQAVAAAKQRIINGLIALLVFFLIFGFLQWLIPGGVFS